MLLLGTLLQEEHYFKNILIIMLNIDHLVSIGLIIWGPCSSTARELLVATDDLLTLYIAVHGNVAPRDIATRGTLLQEEHFFKMILVIMLKIDH